MPVAIQLEYTGGLRCAATHGPSGARLQTDAPTDNQGRGEAFSPTDLVATALGTCILTIMGQVAERHQVDLTGTTVAVTKHMVADPKRRIGRIELIVRVAAPVPEKLRPLFVRTAAACPVHHSLDPRIEVPVEFLWPDR